MSLTRGQIRSRLYKKIPGLGWTRTATTIASGGQTVVDAVAFQDSNASEGNLVGCYIYRPLATAANQFRIANVVSTNSLTFGGLAYSGDAAVLDYEIVGMIHPDLLNEAIRVGLRKVYFECYTPLNTLWANRATYDADFNSSSASSPYDWTSAASGSTITKSATTLTNDRGDYSLVVTNAGYTQGSSAFVEPGDTVVHGCSMRVTSSSFTGTYSLRNITGSTALETVTTTSLAFQHVLRITQIPSGCYEIAQRFQVAGSGTPVAHFDYSFGHKSGRESGQVPMPSWLTQKARLIDFGPAKYGRATANNQYNASSRRWLGQDRVVDYELYPFTEEAQKYVLQVNANGGLEERDYWIHGWRQESDIVDLTDETSSTNAREDIVMAAATYEVCDRLYMATKEPTFLKMQADAKLELDAQLRSERPAVGKQEIQFYAPGSRI